MRPELLESFIELYRQEVEGIFRFHALRSADWISAQALTVETFFTAMQFYDPVKIGPGHKRIWLWQTALLVKEHQRRDIDGLSYSGDILPTQDQLAIYARAAQLSAALENAAPIERDALALHYAGDLVPEEIQDILAQDLERVHEWVARRGDPEQVRMVRSIRPVGYFYNHLEGELRKRAAMKANRRINLEGPLLWLARYRLRSVVMWFFRFVLLMGLTYLLLTAWNSYTRFPP